MGIRIVVNYEKLPGEAEELQPGTILGDLLEGSLPAALKRLAQLEAALRELVGAENFSLSITTSCPNCGAGREVATDGMMQICPGCGTEAERVPGLSEM